MGYCLLVYMSTSYGSDQHHCVNTSLSKSKVYENCAKQGSLRVEKWHEFLSSQVVEPSDKSDMIGKIIHNS